MAIQLKAVRSRRANARSEPSDTTEVTVMSNAGIVAPPDAPINAPDPIPPTYDDVHSLALDLCAHEGYLFATAMHIAARDLGVELAAPTPWEPTATNDDPL